MAASPTLDEAVDWHAVAANAYRTILRSDPDHRDTFLVSLFMHQAALARRWGGAVVPRAGIDADEILEWFHGLVAFIPPGTVIGAPLEDQSSDQLRALRRLKNALLPIHEFVTLG